MALDDRDADKQKLFSRRAAILGGGQLALFAVLAGRMYYLQVIESQQYEILAEENRVNVRLLPPLRGEVVDRFGKKLATNRQNFRVVLIPEQTDDVEATLDKLSDIIPITERTRKRILKDVSQKRGFVPLTVAENLEWEDFAEINIHTPDLPGLQPEVGDTRHYPYGEDLAHVVGYVAAVSDSDLEGANDPLLQLPGFRVGRSGVERLLESELRGRAGNSRVEVNAFGRVIRELAKVPGTPGDEVVLTLDMDIQRFATERVRGESASVVVMDVHSGELVAIVSAPGFDPNLFNVGLSQAEWDGLTNNELNPLVNKTLAGQYPPGSTYKMIVALAALEAGAMTPQRLVNCGGKVTLGSHDFHCWKRGGHGPVNMVQAIQQSCNVYFYELSKRVGIDKIEEMSRRFGLGDQVAMDMAGEKPGLVPSRGWKRATTGIPWQQGETLNAAIGQGYLLTTPVQLATMSARFANGGKAVRPWLVRSVGGRARPAPQAVPMGIAPENMEVIQRGMDAVVNIPGGTAFRSRLPLEGLAMAGKTGTALVRRISREERARGVTQNEDLPWRFRDHALFVGYGPVANPRYAISVIVDHGGGGSAAAAPVAKDVMTRVLTRDPMALAAYEQSVHGRDVTDLGDGVAKGRG
ncbi:penicillin-binding protein 2 [Pyruvatibacter sp.]|uniref:penicillin-binding protein 2 n=1 Tax=Pyruvatibacter sp. TaxID=1981328 RepID=UPI0032ECA15F